MGIDTKPRISDSFLSSYGAAASTSQLSAAASSQHLSPLTFSPLDTSTSGNSRLDATKAVPIKQRRRQLVACDGCRLRRVKCNKADVGDGPCAECQKKSLTCTDNYVKNKPRSVRTGKLIEKARVLYGDGSAPIDLPPQTTPPAGATVSPISPADSSDSHSSRNRGGFEVNASLIRASEARFGNLALQRAISSHLINVYHDMIHLQAPICDWDHFSRVWDASGRDIDNLSPTAEALALVIQAWAARFSDHPSIIGDGGPSLSRMRAAPLTNYTACGQRRDSFARSMADRAVEKVDQSGILRRPSGQAAAALIMLEFLLTWGDTSRSSGRHLLVAAIEHLRTLNEGAGDDPTEDPNMQHRTSGGTLFWMAYTRDALSSAFAGRSTCLSDDDVATLCEIVVMPVTGEVIPFVTSNDPRTLCGLAVVAIFRHITNVTRSYSVRIGGPLPRRARLSERAVRELWHEIDRSTEYSAQFYDSIRNTQWSAPPKSDVWFRDLASMRTQTLHALDRNLTERLVAEERVEMEVGAQDSTFHAYVDRVRLLKQESSERLLIAVREMAKLARSYGTSLIFETGLSCENLSYYLDHLLLTQPCELGGPENWSTVSKIEETQWIIDAMKLQGFCWPNYDRQIEAAQIHLAQLAAHTHVQPLQQSSLTPTRTGMRSAQPYPIFDFEALTLARPPPPEHWERRPSDAGSDVDQSYAYEMELPSLQQLHYYDQEGNPLSASLAKPDSQQRFQDFLQPTTFEQPPPHEFYQQAPAFIPQTNYTHYG